MKKFVLSLVLVLLVVAVMISTVFAETTPAEANSDLFIIECEEDFLTFVKDLKIYGQAKGKYLLNTDIYLDRYYEKSNELLGIFGIGLPFEGSFDGRGHAIVGLKEPLFHTISEGAEVKNLQLIGVSYEDKNNVMRYGLAKVNNGTISNVQITATIVNSNSFYPNAFVLENNGTIASSLAVINEVSGSPAYLNGSGQFLDSYAYSTNSIEQGDMDFLLDGIDSYAELNLALLKTQDKKLNASLNLYNTPFVGIGNNPVSLTRYLPTENSVQFFNTSSLPYVVTMERTYAEGTEPLPVENLLTGVGTKDQPYLISSLSDLLGIHSINSGEYALLTNDLNLDLYDFDGQETVVYTLACHFDGAGHSITMGNGYAPVLFNEISEGASVKNLNLVGSLANTNIGTITNVTAITGEDSFVGNNKGVILRADVKGATFLGSNDNIVAYSRFEGEKFTNEVSSVENSGFSDCYFINTGASATTVSSSMLATNHATSVVYNLSDSTYDYSSDITLYKNFPEIDGWAFGTTLKDDGDNLLCDGHTWGYKSGTTEDVITLVVASDRIGYKEIKRYDEKSTTIPFNYRSGREAYELRTLPTSTDLTNYDQFISGNNTLYYSADEPGVIYELTDGLFEIDNVLTIAKNLYPMTSKTTEIVGIWKIKPIGGEYRDFTESYIDPVNYPNTVLNYTALNLNYFEINVTVTDKIVMEFGYEVSNITAIDIASYLDLAVTYGASYADAIITFEEGYREGYDYGQISSAYFEHHTGEKKQYVISVEIPATESRAKSFTYYYANLGKGTIDDSFLDFELGCEYGGTTEDTAIIYGTPFGLLTDSIYVKNYSNLFVKCGEVLKFKPIYQDYYVEGSGIKIKDAGHYVLKVTYYSQLDKEENQFYLEPREGTVDIYVAPRPVEVFAQVNGSCNPTLNYYDALNVTYHTKDGGILTDLKEMDYELYLVEGENRVDYKGKTLNVLEDGKTYTLEVLCPTSNVHNPNYIITKYLDGPKVQITIAPVQITIDDEGWKDESITYVGLIREPFLMSEYVKHNTLDRVPDYTLEYSYNGITQSEPFGFYMVGTYEIGVQVKCPSINYLDSEIKRLTLTISPKELLLSALDTTVDYNEEAEYKLSVTAKDGEELEENYLDFIALGTDYTITSTYQKGEGAGATYPITLTLLNTTVGNYVLEIGSPNATLTVTKKTYNLTMVTEYEYTGDGVKLIFKEGDEIVENIPFSEGYPKFYKLRNGLKEAFTGTPVEASDSTFRYVAEYKIEESTEYNAVALTEVEFSINPKVLTFTGLYVFHKGNKYPLSEYSSFVYDKEDYEISIDDVELSTKGSIVGANFKFRYKFVDNNGVEHYYEDANPIILSEVISLTEVSFSLGENSSNYVEFKTEEYTFSITPKKVRLVDLPTVTYIGNLGYSLELITERVNNLGYVEGYELIEGDTTSYKVAFKNGGTTIVKPGTYFLEVTSTNKNYVIDPSEDYTIKQTINTGTIAIDLSDVDFGTYEFGILGTENDRNYIDKEITFTLDGNQTKTDVIRFNVDFNSEQSGLLAPGIYPINSARSEEEDGTVLTEYAVSNGKVQIIPLEIAFSYEDMLSKGKGIKPTYTYGDSALSDLPNRVNRAQTWALSGLEYTEIPDVRVGLTGTVVTPKHVGEYTFTAKAYATGKNYEGEEVYLFTIKENLLTYKMTVLPKKVTISIAPIEIKVGEDEPTAFSPSYPIASEQPFTSDELVYAYDVIDFSSAGEGQFPVSVTIKVKDGEDYYYDYEVVKYDQDAKEVSVTLYEFENTLTVESVTSTYTSFVVYPKVNGLPEGAEVTYSMAPVDVGTYDVVVTISKPNYRDKVVGTEVVITKATPYVEFTGDKNIRFDVRHLLSSEDVNAVARNGMIGVPGEFYFISTAPMGAGEYLRVGEYTYKIGFRPESDNYNVVEGLNYTMTSYVSAEDYTLTINGEAFTGSTTSSGDVTLTLTTTENLSGVMHLVVDGFNTYYSNPSNVYVYEESINASRVALMIYDEEIVVNLISVNIEREEPEVPEPPVEPENPDTPDTPGQGGEGSTEQEPGGNNAGNNGSSGNLGNVDGDEGEEEGANLGLIIGLSSGIGAVVIVVVVVLIVVFGKRKKDQQ